MPRDLILSPEVANDLADAYLWYEERGSGLGEDFLARVEDCLQLIQRNPLLHAVVHEGYRRGLVHRFPYAVFFEVDESKITLYGVFHAARDPEKWRKRLAQ